MLPRMVSARSRAVWAWRRSSFSVRNASRRNVAMSILALTRASSSRALNGLLR